MKNTEKEYYTHLCLQAKFLNKQTDKGLIDALLYMAFTETGGVITKKPEMLNMGGIFVYKTEDKTYSEDEFIVKNKYPRYTIAIGTIDDFHEDWDKTIIAHYDNKEIVEDSLKLAKTPVKMAVVCDNETGETCLLSNIKYL